MNAPDSVTPPNTANDLDDLLNEDTDETNMDDMVDGDRQLTTDSDAIDGGLNDSDLGSPRDDVMTEEESDIDTAGPATI